VGACWAGPALAELAVWGPAAGHGLIECAQEVLLFRSFGDIAIGPFMFLKIWNNSSSPVRRFTVGLPS